MIETERLILRPWMASDAEALFRHASHPNLGPPAGWEPHPSVDYSREVIRSIFSLPEVYAVVPKDCTEPVGLCGIVPSSGSRTSDIDEDDGEISYWIAVPFQGRGLIPKAVSALMERAFSLLGYNALWCGIFSDNAKSMSVCRKCGLTFHHSAEVMQADSGERKREDFFRITAAEFAARQTGSTS